MTHQLGEASIQEDYQARMNALAKGIDEIFSGELKGDDRHTAFVLLDFLSGRRTVAVISSRTARTAKTSFACSRR